MLVPLLRWNPHAAGGERPTRGGIMRSAASVQGHPIHAMLIPFPIAFLVGAFLTDLAGLVAAQEVLRPLGGFLASAGIVAALLAAVPGAVDYYRTVPPQSSGKQRATKHALSNLGAVALFALGLWLRGGLDGAPSAASLGLWAVGLALLTMGGWMGGTLVYRNQIGVDHRYAGAGKWNEEHVPGGARPIVARADELDVDQMKLVHVDGERIVVARTEDGYVAFEDRCPHRGGSLAGGSMMCGTVQCPWHGSQFGVRDGVLKAGPAEHGIRPFPVEVEGNEVRLIR
jgi:nitrite reductase/ring-hydroxylating ferredoxin subunit/uncharacterized membrane protein